MSAVAGAALCTGTLEHRRRTPVEHAFQVPVQMAWIPLGELPGVFDGLPLWSARRPAPVWLRRVDYADGGTGALDEVVRDIVAARLGVRPMGPVAMLTNLRTLGYVFNPITVYFCGEPGSADEVVVLEVTNTPWKDRHWYVVPGPVARAGAAFPKALHVSPFLTMEGEYRLELSGPGPELRVGLALVQGGATVFGARLALRCRPLTARAAVGALLDRPLLTYRVWSGIHGQALRLWRRGVPYVPRPRPGAEGTP